MRAGTHISKRTHTRIPKRAHTYPLASAFSIEKKNRSKYASAGFRVMAFPCNQFGRQEPGTKESIEEFAKRKHGVTFDLYQKIEGMEYRGPSLKGTHRF